MYENIVAKRVRMLRKQKGVSAHSMSLDIGQNIGYISTIEKGKSLPSMSGFFYICEYFGITPQEFFDDNVENPTFLKDIIDDLKRLDAMQLETIATLIKTMIRK